MIKHYFLKSIFNNLNGIEDAQIKIRGIEDYATHFTEREFILLTRRVEVRASLWRDTD